MKNSSHAIEGGRQKNYTKYCSRVGGSQSKAAETRFPSKQTRRKKIQVVVHQVLPLIHDKTNDSSDKS